MKRKIWSSLAIFLYAIIACALVWMIYHNGDYPGGADTFSHLYKGDTLYREIAEGNFYPLLDSMWYNGSQMMRYSSPLPVYTLAFCEALTGGNLFYGYLLFVGLLFFFGGLVWFWIGKRHGRTRLGIFIGMVWFFMPNNLYLLFEEGNLPRAMCNVFLPWIVEQVYLYVKEKYWQNLLGVIGSFFLLVLCDPQYAGMILLAAVLVLMVYSFRYRAFRQSIHVVIGMAIAILLTGLWLYPLLQGNTSSPNTSQIMENFFQDILISLNPFYRIKYGTSSAFYFGFASFLVLLIGMLFGKNKSSVYFGCAFVILLCTGSSMYMILSHFPGQQYLQMLYYISIALSMILFGLILWNTLKKSWLKLFCVLLVLDVLPSMPLVYGDLSGRTVEERLDEAEDYALITTAKKITTQRLALLDLGSMDAAGSFLISGYKDAIATSFGADLQAANTANNLVMLNEALQTGRYVYLFDRCLEMGNDSVIIQINQLDQGYNDIEKMQNAAETVGYRLAAENENYRLYHLDTYDNFGVISCYQAIGIGEAAEIATMDYPSMEHGDSDNLNDYSYQELKDYQLIFLNGFTYENKSQAEELVMRLSENGVKVVIQADGIPIDEHTGIQSFLDVNCQPLTFTNGYPVLDTIDGQLDCELFPQEYTTWRAMYLNGLDECWGKIEELGEEMEFYGTVKNENIVMVGLNLSYYYSLTLDESVGKLLEHAMTISESDLPERTLVPLNVKYEKDRIIIQSDYDDVNTTIVYQDIFDENSGIYHKNHLTYVNQGKTIIQLSYPYLWQGIGISMAGLVLMVVYLVYVCEFWKTRNIKKIEVTEVMRPVRGEQLCSDVRIPDAVKYFVSEVKWYDAEAKEMDKEQICESIKYRIRVMLSAKEGEYFDKDAKATVNGLNADRVEFLNAYRHAWIEMSFQTIEPFCFLKQPADMDCTDEEPAVVVWMISKKSEVGYLQVMEENRWVISETIPKEPNQELSVHINYEGSRMGRYRLVYITSGGQMQYSDEFVVRWHIG